MADHVEMSGTGVVRDAPDLAVLQVGVQHSASGVGEAIRGCGDASARAARALDGAGIAAADRQTSSLDVQNEWRGDRPVGFLASQTLTVRLRDVDAVDTAVQALADALGDDLRVHGLSWSFSDPSARQRRARELAWADAHEKARQLAALSGRSLGEVVRVREAGSGGMPGARFAMAASADSSGMHTAPGESELSAGLVVRWRLVDAC